MNRTKNSKHTAKNDGRMKQDGDTIVLTFERELKHPVDKVWARLTEPDLIKTWMADGGGEIDLRVGGKIHLFEGGGEWVNSHITALEPQKLLEFGFKSREWDGGRVRFELSPAGDGTRLVLTHEMPHMTDAEQADFSSRFELPEGWEQRSSTLAGWHTILDRLPHALVGKPVDWEMDVWKKHHKRYKEKIGASSGS